ncbi:MAG: VapB-type antitoxin [Candidatus Korarchaeota archaeon]|nr:VapB-type antitoxin [Candidatus Korarchaeota archaeon]
MNNVSETIRVSKSTKERLVRLAARLQEKRGRRITLDEAIRFLLDARERKSELLLSIFGSIPDLSTEELYEERKEDEKRASRRYGI